MRQIPILFSTPMVQAIQEELKTQTRRAIKPQPELREFIGNQTGNKILGWQIPGTDKFWQTIDTPDTSLMHCPYGKIGDILWVREVHYKIGHWEKVPGIKTKTGRMKWRFVSDSDEVRYYDNAPDEYRKGRHSKDPGTSTWHKRLARFMAKSYCRIFLEIKSIKVERLKSISNEDALAEGIDRYTVFDTMVRYSHYGEARKDFIRGSEYGFDSGKETQSAEVASYCCLWMSINGRESWISNPWVWVIEFKKIEKPA
jgi:hypothetical protein